MLALWTEALPVFIVRWLARKRCGTVSIGRREAHEARPGVFILTKGRRVEGEGG